MGVARKLMRGCRKALLADQVGILLMLHFPDSEPSGKDDPFTDLCCEDCEDLRQGLCGGQGRKGWSVVKCMEGKARNGGMGFVVDGPEVMQ